MDFFLVKKFEHPSFPKDTSKFKRDNYVFLKIFAKNSKKTKKIAKNPVSMSLLRRKSADNRAFQRENHAIREKERRPEGKNAVFSLYCHSF